MPIGVDRKLAWPGIIGWALVGLLVGSIAQIAHVRQIGGLEGTLRLGDESPARFLIADELGRVPLTKGTGHDGFQSYLVARDPFAANADEYGFYVGYRHRRLMSPLLSGLGGTLSPRATLWGLSVTTILGFALSAGAIAAIAQLLGARPWAPVGSVVNIGALLSVQLVTPDALANGFALAAAVAVLRRRHLPAALLMAASLLTKETSVLFAAGLIAYLWMRREQRGAAWMMASVIPLLLWTGYVNAVVGGGFETQGNLTILPFAGIVATIGDWRQPVERVLGGTALVAMAVALVGLVRSRSAILWATAAPWLLTAVFSSSEVWRGGNNAVRVYAILWTIGILGIAVSLESTDHHQPVRT